MIASKNARGVLAVGGPWLLLVGAALAQRGEGRLHDPKTDRFGPSLEAVDGKGGTDISGPYQVVADWPQPLHSDFRTNRVAGVYAESPDRIYVATSGEVPHFYERGWAPESVDHLIPMTNSMVSEGGRWEHILLVFDGSGKLIESWDQWDTTVKGPNRIVGNPYDPERHVWVADQSANQILKFTRDGAKLVMTVGEKDVPEMDSPARFQDLAFMPNGDFYVAGGSRVVKFSEDGTYLSSFGKAGRTAPGEMRGIHGIAIDAKNGRLYISDKDNSRIQIFDLEGRFLDTWPNILYPMSLRLSEDGQHLWVGDGYAQKFLKFNLDGTLLTSWGTFGSMPGAFWGLHAFDVDSEGNLYVCEDYGGRQPGTVDPLTRLRPHRRRQSGSGCHAADLGFSLWNRRKIEITGRRDVDSGQPVPALSGLFNGMDRAYFPHRSASTFLLDNGGIEA
jgi:sugar lactone lactonase YvrE